ncbi:MAG: DsbA family protein [Maricaulaceae bacterium]
MRKLQIDMVSDIVCPWCWLGLKRLDRALEAFDDVTAALQFHPHELDPSVPEDGVEYRAYMRAKFGPSGPSNRFQQMREHLEAAGPDYGIDFRFDTITRRPNTLNCHRLIKWAQGQGKSRAVKEALFAAYFRDAQDLSDPAVLTAVASAVGLDVDLIQTLLEGDRDKDAVRGEEAHFQRLGVTGVPFFIFNGRVGVPGAQEPEILRDAMRKALSSEAA